MTAEGFQPPSYYQPRRSPSPVMLMLIAAALIFVIGGVLACAMGLGPFAPAPPATPGASTNRPTSSLSPGASGLPTTQPTLTSPGQRTETPTGQPPETSAPSGPPPTIPADALGKLLAHVPESIRATCTEATIAPPVIAAVNCLSGPEIAVTYSAYPDAGGMNVDYDSSVARAQIDRDSGLCYQVNADGSLTATMDRWPSEHSYTAGGVPVGRFFCIERGLPTITWTDDRVNILGLATASTGNADRLVTFWLNEAGPVP